jgi:hypothetical protein
MVGELRFIVYVIIFLTERLKLIMEDIKTLGAALLLQTLCVIAHLHN